MSLFASTVYEKDFKPKGALEYLGLLEISERDIWCATHASARKRKDKRVLLLEIIEKYHLRMISAKSQGDWVTHWDVWASAPEAVSLLKGFIDRDKEGKKPTEADNPAERQRLVRFEARKLTDLCLFIQGEDAPPIIDEESGRELLTVAYERLGLNAEGKTNLNLVGAPEQTVPSRPITPEPPCKTAREELEELELMRECLTPKGKKVLDREWVLLEAQEAEDARKAAEAAKGPFLIAVQGGKAAEATQWPSPAPMRSREEVRERAGQMGLRVIDGGRPHAM